MDAFLDDFTAPTMPIGVHPDPARPQRHTIGFVAVVVMIADLFVAAATAGLRRFGEFPRLLWRRLASAGPAGREAWLVSLISAIAYLVVNQSGAGTRFVRFISNRPEYHIDDIMLGTLVVGIGTFVFSIRRWRDLRREVAIRELAEERLDRAHEIAGIASWEFDVSANRYIWSKQMYRLRGLSPVTFEPTSSAVAAYVHPDDEPAIRQYRDDLKAGTLRGPTEVRVIHPGGEIHVLRVVGRPIIDNDGIIRRVSGTAQDITEQKLMQRQLAQSQKMEVIGHLAGGMAHDFNNVLGIVIANLEFLQDHVADNAAAEELCMDALSGALHGAELTRRLLAFARRQPLLPQEIDANELIRATARLLARLLSEHIELDLSLDPALWRVSVDPAQLEAALTNLASNARDAMGRGGRLTIATRNLQIVSRGTIECPDLGPGDYVLVEVSDTGIGIPPDVIGKIFEPFFTTKEQGKGSGLGLSMVLGFIEQSGGRVTVQSRPEAGTTFRLYLPRSFERELKTARTDDLPGRSAVLGRLETVLVVEDNAKLRRATVRRLVDLGYRVFEAADAQTASTVLEINNAVSLLFTDVVMPGGMDGIELVEWALARRPGLRCLLTSGFSDLGGRQHRIKALGCKLLSKPYHRTELAQAIRDTLDHAHSLQQT